MNIRIRHFEKNDADAIKQIYAKPHVVEGTLQLPYQSVEMWQSRLEVADKNFICLVAEQEGKVVGQLGLHLANSLRRKHVATLVIAVSVNVQGKGVAHQLMKAALDLCDNWLNVRRIELQVFVDNERAISLYKKHKFKIEGELVDFGFKCGEYVNAYSMARISKA